MNIETAEIVKSLVIKRENLYKEYNATTVSIINKNDLTEEFFNKVKILLWQEINEIDNQIKQIQC